MPTDTPTPQPGAAKGASCKAPGPITQSAATPCVECPWRKSNVDRPVPPGYEGTYGREQHVQGWRELRHGYPNHCHLSLDAAAFPNQDDPLWIEAGFLPVPEDPTPRECAGAVAVVLRELQTFLNCGLDFEEYRRQRPQGFTEPALILAAERWRGVKVSDRYPRMRRIVHLKDDDLIDPPTDRDIADHELMHPAQLSQLADLSTRVLQALREGGHA